MSESTGTDGSNEHHHHIDEASQVAYNTCAVVIFAIMSFTFLFPCNRLIPLDRRTVAVFCATLCFITRRFVFRDQTLDLAEDVEFDVLVLLASIMAINHIVVHLKETNGVIKYIQKVIQDTPLKGFWIVSFAAFAISPFLTNDGVCLLFVQPILDAFENLDDPNDNLTREEIEGHAILSASKSIADIESYSSSSAAAAATAAGDGQVSLSDKSAEQLQLQKLSQADAIYFLLALACASNIGSALTYTGNPQNMIVAQDSIGVLPPYKFLALMILPSTLSWLITTLWIQYCWKAAKKAAYLLEMQSKTEEEQTGLMKAEVTPIRSRSRSHSTESSLTMTKKNGQHVTLMSSKSDPPGNCLPQTISASSNPMTTLSISVPSDPMCGLQLRSTKSPIRAVSSPLSPRRRNAKKREEMIKSVVYIVSSPFPYMILILLAAMIVMIFVDVVSIAGLICISAMVMVVCLVLGNHWRGKPIWSEQSADEEGKEEGDQLQQQQPMTRQDKVDNMNDFFEELFKSLDYSLLLIFLGTFIVVANIETTGIPRKIWSAIVGKVPFNTFGSIVGISAFVLIASQLLGNVAVIQLAKPNIEVLGDTEKKLAWAIISFVATIGGNLTITGSAANIIVAEKSARIDPNASLDFFTHFKVCFWITLGCCFIGGVIISCLVYIDNLVLSQ